MAKTPILNLDDLVDAPQVQINGTLYSLRTQEEISPIEAHRFRKLGTRLDELTSKDGLNELELAELESLPKKLCQEVLSAPVDVIDSLRDSQRMAILHAFIRTLQGNTTPQPAESETAATETTGAE